MSFSTKLSSHSLFRRICASHLCHKTIRQLSQDPRNGAPANWTTAYFALLRARLQQPITSTRLVACVAVVAHQRCSSTCVHCASRLWSHHSEVRLLRIQCELGNWQVDGTEYDEICKVLEENLLCKTSRKYFIQVLLVIFRKCRSLSSGLGAVKLALYEIWEVLIFFFFLPLAPAKSWHPSACAVHRQKYPYLFHLNGWVAVAHWRYGYRCRDIVKQFAAITKWLLALILFRKRLTASSRRGLNFTGEVGQWISRQ